MIKVVIKNQAKSSHKKKNHTEKKDDRHTDRIIVCGDYIIILHANVFFILSFPSLCGKH